MGGASILVIGFKQAPPHWMTPSPPQMFLLQAWPTFETHLATHCPFVHVCPDEHDGLLQSPPEVLVVLIPSQ